MIQRLIYKYYNLLHDYENKAWTWRCPVCQSSLWMGGLEAYETLDEHVMDPNAEPAKKRTWICRTIGCLLSANQQGLPFFGIDGGLYAYGKWKENMNAVYSFDWLLYNQRRLEKSWWYKLLQCLDPIYWYEQVSYPYSKPKMWLARQLLKLKWFSYKKEGFCGHVAWEGHKVMRAHVDTAEGGKKGIT